MLQPPAPGATTAAGRRILVIKLGALGDFFLAQTAFAGIRRHHAGDHLTLLTIPALAPLARQSGLFDAVLEDPRGRSPDAYRTLRSILREGRFDRVYDLQGQSRTERYFWLMAPGPWPEWSGPARGCSHPDRYPGRARLPAGERHARQLRPFGIELPEHPDLGWLDGERPADAPAGPYALLFPGSAPHRPEKRWPAERYGALAASLAARGLTPVVAGTAAETPLAAAIRAACPQAIDLTGRTSLAELAGLARHAAVAVGNDTGPTHLAAAVGTPTVALFVDQPTPIQVTGARVLVHHRPDFAAMDAAGVMEAVDRVLAGDSGGAPAPSGDVPPPDKPRSGRVALAAKLVVSLGVFAALAVQADWAPVAERVANASPLLLLLGVLLKLAAILFSAERWRWAAAAAGARIGAWTSLKLMTAGLFFGQVLPGALGGDVVRGWLTWRSGAPAATVVTTLILDRLLALLGVVAIMALGTPHLLAVAPPAVAWSAAAATVVLALGVAIGLQADRLPLPTILRRPPVTALLGQVARLRQAALTPAALMSALHATAVHTVTIGAVVAFGQALGLTLSFMDALAVVPLAIFAAALPISLNGWGVREGAMAAGLALYGIGTAEAVTLSLLIGLSVMVLSLPGGLLWLSLGRPDGRERTVAAGR